MARMNVRKFIISAILPILGLSGRSDAQGLSKIDWGKIKLKNLNTIGVNPENIFNAFMSQHGVRIELNEVLKVSTEDEGKNIRFESLDHFSVVVPIMSASGPRNKLDGTGF